MSLSQMTDPYRGTEHPEFDRKPAGRKPTVEEAEAMLTLIRGGWLKVELTLEP